VGGNSMDSTEALSPTEVGSAGATIPLCPECDLPCGGIGSTTTSLIEGEPLHRCQSCGTRFCWNSGIARRVVTCRRCCLPIATATSESMPDRTCGDCSDTDAPVELFDEALVKATDAELRAALETKLRFMGHSNTRPYLRRLVRTLGSALEGLPAESEVVVFDDTAQRILMLPTGSLLVSTALLAGLEDEAELAFVLGREFLHLECGEVAARTVRVGLAAAAGHEAQWADVAGDLMRLGYGSEREYASDLAAIELMTTLGYAQQAALNYLGRQAARVEVADPAVSELAQAGPPFSMRLSRLAMKVRGAVLPGKERFNREPFRRAVGAKVLSEGLQPVSEPVLLREDDEAPVRSWRRPLGWLVAAVLLALAAIAVVRQLLFD